MVDSPKTRPGRRIARIGLFCHSYQRSNCKNQCRVLTLDSYRPRNATVVGAGDANERASVAQLVPAAEIH
jgi:hypothetical protein